jgi:Putative zinc-finger
MVEESFISACPDDFDERSELYFLRRLPRQEASRLESHVAVCPACLVEIDADRAFLSCLRDALQQ